MMRDVRVNICGTGAMACLFGARLACAARVTLLGTWRDALEAISANGIRAEDDVVGPSRVAVAGLDENTEPADLVLVLVKTWQNSRIAARLRGLAAPGGVVLTLQNGIGNREALGPAVCAGTTSSGASLIAPGFVRAGGEGPTYAAAPSWVIHLLRGAGIETHGCGQAEIDSILWGKLVASCGINAATALLGIRNGTLVRHPDAEALMIAAAFECANVARAKGIALPFEDPAAHARTVAVQTARNTSSMLQDLRRGAPTEIEAINGAVVREAAKAGIPVPVNETLWRLVRAAAGSPKGVPSCK